MLWVWGAQFILTHKIACPACSMKFFFFNTENFIEKTKKLSAKAWTVMIIFIISNQGFGHGFLLPCRMQMLRR